MHCTRAHFPYAPSSKVCIKSRPSINEKDLKSAITFPALMRNFSGEHNIIAMTATINFINNH